MSESKATPRPWYYIGDYIVGVLGTCECKVTIKDGETDAVYPDYEHESHEVVKPIMEDDLDGSLTMEEHIANCHLIVTAVNAHDDLLAACDPDTLDAIADEINSFEHSARVASLRVIAKKQRAAIKKAEGETK